MIFTLYKFIKIYVNLYTIPQKSGRHKSRPQKHHILNQLCKRDVEGAVPYILPRLLNTKKLIRYVRQALLHALTSEALYIILGKQLVSVFRIRINSAVVPIAIV